MKKIFIILISIGMISFSCDTPDNSPTVIGFSTGENGERSDITLESDVAEVWVEYLKAHNDTIMRSTKILFLPRQTHQNATKIYQYLFCIEI